MKLIVALLILAVSTKSFFYNWLVKSYMYIKCVNKIVSRHVFDKVTSPSTCFTEVRLCYATYIIMTICASVSIETSSYYYMYMYFCARFISC